MILKTDTEFEGMMVKCMLPAYDCLYREMYKVVDKETDETRTLIVYDTGKMLSDEHCKLPKREAEMMQKMNSPEFPKFLSFGQKKNENGTRLYWIVVEPCYSFTLRTCVTLNPLAANDAMSIVRDVMFALSKLEKAWSGAIHCNLSPDTIRICCDKDGSKSVILDGLQFVVTGPNDYKYVDKDILNRCTCAPEATVSGAYSQKTMEYSLAMLYVYMVTGKYPYGINEDMDLLKLFRNKRYRKPALDLSMNIKKIIDKALSSDSSKRFGTLEEFVFSLLDQTVVSSENDYEAKANSYKGKNKEKKEEIFTHPAKVSPLIQNDDEDDEEDDDGGTCMEQSLQQPTQPKIRVSISTRNGKGFAAVAGMNALKLTLKRDFIDIINNQDMAAAYGINVPGLLLYGAPGNGKTYIAQRLGEELGIPVSYVCPSDLGSIYIHGSQGLIKELFEKATKKAKGGKGCLLIIDEIDAVCPSRTLDDHNNQAGEVAEFLTQMNTAASKGVYVIGCTNLITRVDKALLRTGRLDKVIYVPMPDFEARKELFLHELLKRPHEEGIDLCKLSNRVEGFTSSDISYIVGEAARQTFSTTIEKGERTPEKITEQMLLDIISQTRSSVSPTELQSYEQMRDEFSSGKKNNLPRVGFNVG